MQNNFSNNKKAYGFLALRWLLLPLLFYAFGGFLEGPPTRVVVRSFPFVAGCFTLSIMAAQFLQQVRRIPIALSLLLALFIPSGYVYFAQLYYDGGKNLDYSIAIGIFFLLMMLNAGLYLNGLFALRQKDTSTAEDIESASIEYDEEYVEEEDQDEWEPVPIKRYQIILYELNPEGQRGKIVLRKQGNSELPEYLTVDGFSSNRYIDLRGYWDEIIENECEQYCADLATYETIVKFGDTMQLVDKYQIVFILTYQHI